MADLKFEVDVEAIAKSLQNFKKELEKDINKSRKNYGLKPIKLFEVEK